MFGADKVSPPRAGLVKSVALTGSTVATIDLNDYVDNPRDIAGYWTLLADVELHVMTGPLGVSDPDTSVDGDGDEPFGPWPEKTPFPFVAAYPNDRIVKVLPAADGTLTIKKG